MRCTRGIHKYKQFHEGEGGHGMKRNLLKSLAAIGLAVCMTVGMGMTVLAAESGDNTPTASERTTVKLDVQMTASGENAKDTYLGDTITFSAECTKITDSAITDAPELEVGDIAIPADAFSQKNTFNADAVITIPAYQKVGVFTYKVTPKYNVNNDGGEVANAGVDYSDLKPFYVVVTVTDDNGTLSSTIAIHKNEEGLNSGKDDAKKMGDGDGAGLKLEYHAGDLAISKQVTGNMGDKTKYFDVKVTLTGQSGKNYKEAYSLIGGNYENGDSITVGTVKTVQVKHGDTLTIKGIPAGVTYTVEENDYTSENNGKYDEATYKFSNINKEISDITDTVTITNNKSSEIDTGVSLDSLPYILILAGVAVAGVLLVMRKRSSDNF
jgi:hypothetical protein